MEVVTRAALPHDLPALKALWQDAFHESRSFLDWFFATRFLPDCSVVTECGGTIVSALHGLPAHVRVRDSILRCIIVSGVATLPEYRRKGYMRRGFSHLFAQMRARGIPLAVHTPVDLRIYAPLGHYAVSDAQFVTRSADAPRPDTSEPVVELPLSGNLGALYGCYAQSTRGYSASLERTYADFAFKCADYASDGARCIGIPGAQGQLNGYCVYFESDGALDGEECLARTPDGYQSLFAALARRANGKRLSLRLPPDVALDCPQADTALRPHCAMGVADVAPLLAATGLTGGAIEVTDAFTQQNAGVYTLDGTRTNEPPQIRISAGRLAQWAAGYRSMAELVARGDATALDAAAPERLDVIGKRICFTVDEY